MRIRIYIFLITLLKIDSIPYNRLSLSQKVRKIMRKSTFHFRLFSNKILSMSIVFEVKKIKFLYQVNMLFHLFF